MKEIIIIGSGGHSRSCVDVIKSEAKFTIAGYVDNTESSKFKSKDNLYLGDDSDLSYLRTKFDYAHIGIGQIKEFKKRRNIYNNLKKLNFILPTIKSTYSIISKKSLIEDGTIIMHQVVVNSHVKIGSNCIINTGSILEHDVIVEDNCHIAPGAVLLGGVNVHKNSFIGARSIIFQNVSVKEGTIIPAGTIVKENV